MEIMFACSSHSLKLPLPLRHAQPPNSEDDPEYNNDWPSPPRQKWVISLIERPGG